MNPDEYRRMMRMESLASNFMYKYIETADVGDLSVPKLEMAVARAWQFAILFEKSRKAALETAEVSP